MVTGDIAPDVPGAAGQGQSIQLSLVGSFARLIAVVVVAAMFITAEYRHGLVRTTLAAIWQPRQVLAAKAIVIATVTFAAEAGPRRPSRSRSKRGHCASAATSWP